MVAAFEPRLDRRSIGLGGWFFRDSRLWRDHITIRIPLGYGPGAGLPTSLSRPPRWRC